MAEVIVARPRWVRRGHHARFPFGGLGHCSRARDLQEHRKVVPFHDLSDALDGVSGQFIAGRKHRPLAFTRAYKEQLWSATEAMVGRTREATAAA